MRVLFTRIANDRHALEVVRADGSRDRAELETRSFWLHDLVHLAVEAEAGIQDGFWGKIAAGRGLAERSDDLMAVEMLVGTVTGALSGAPAEDSVRRISGYFAQVGQGEKLPPWLTSSCLMRVQERLRKLVGRWNGTPFGGTMEVVWKES